MAAPNHEQGALFLTGGAQLGEIAYTVRRSSRARRVTLTVTPERGLVVTLPERFALHRVPAIVTERREWIERAMARFASEREQHLSREEDTLTPASIELRALGERREVRYLAPAERIRVVERGPYLLEVTGSQDESATAFALQRWLRRRAREEIVPWLLDLAQTRQLKVTSTSIRRQRTRWGSCSAKGAISINQNLLFLPRRCARLVLIHELCHLVELNHSPRFWDLLRHEEPDYVALGDELTQTLAWIPRWATLAQSSP